MTKGERFQHRSREVEAAFHLQPLCLPADAYANRSSRPELNGTVTKVYNPQRTDSAMELSFDQNQLADKEKDKEKEKEKEKENGSHREQAADAANF